MTTKFWFDPNDANSFSPSFTVTSNLRNALKDISHPIVGNVLSFLVSQPSNETTELIVLSTKAEFDIVFNMKLANKAKNNIMAYLTSPGQPPNYEKLNADYNHQLLLQYSSIV
jgi:hypothetical protein